MINMMIINSRRSYLNLFDILILTCIFFGMAIFTSTYHYLDLLANQQTAPSHLNFDNQGNWWGIISELLLLIVAWYYLSFRKFDFSKLNFTIHRYTLIKILLYILLAGTVATLSEYLLQFLWASPQDTQQMTEYYDHTHHFSQFSLSLFLFALLNGCFEEVFFLGLVFCVEKRHLPVVFVFSLLVRFAFHTYQGIIGAVVITTLGVVFGLLRWRNDELVPFFLAHSFFDIFGLGLPLYLLLSE